MEGEWARAKVSWGECRRMFEGETLVSLSNPAGPRKQSEPGERTFLTSLSSLMTSTVSLHPRASTSANSLTAWSRTCARTVTLPGAGEVTSSPGETNERRARVSPGCAGGPTWVVRHSGYDGRECKGRRGA